MLTVGSLFSGIGGFDLGLERAGMRVIWQSEIDPYASAVLRKHWPTVPNLGDIRGITAASVADAGNYGRQQQRRSDVGSGERSSRQEWSQQAVAVGRGCKTDILCGGFPCQDISNAGKRAGIDGERSGLWAEFARVIGELRPRYVIVENVAALLGRGIERVLGDLAALGFDAEWHCIPASAVGAPHRRDRVWIIATMADAQPFGHSRGLQAPPTTLRRRPTELGLPSAPMADADQPRLQGRLGAILRECAGERAAWEGDPYKSNGCRKQHQSTDWFCTGEYQSTACWIAEPDVGRVAHGVPKRVDRLRCLGNAIVPQVAEIIGRAIVSAHK